MSKFIEVTVIKQDSNGSKFEEKILLNTHDVVGIQKSDYHKGSLLEIRDRKIAMFVVETYDEIKNMLIRDIISKDIDDL